MRGVDGRNGKPIDITCIGDGQVLQISTLDP